MKFFRTRPLLLIVCVLVGCLLVVFISFCSKHGSVKAGARELTWSFFRTGVLLVKGKGSRAFANLPEIEFHGVVRDLETGEGMPGVSVLMRWDDLSMSGKSQRELITDENGEFELAGVRGGNLYVQVIEPQEYHRLFEGIRPFFVAELATNALPSKANPSVFELRPVRINHSVRSAYGIADSPKKSMGHNFSFDSSGRPVHFQFTDRVFRGKAEHIRIAVKVEFMEEEWDFGDEWMCEVSTPGAGLTEALGRSDFVAPESGYEETRTFRSTGKALWLYFFVRDEEGRCFRANLRLEPFGTKSASAVLWIAMDGGRNFETSKR